MDWISEKTQQIQEKLKNLPLKQAMTGYILAFTALTILLTFAVNMICSQWVDSIYLSHSAQQGQFTVQFGLDGGTAAGHTEGKLFDARDKLTVDILTGVAGWSPAFFSVASMWGVSVLFYRKRLKVPFDILQHGVEKIKSQELDFSMYYDSADEMGQLCDSFEEMRKELVRNKEAMWEMVEKQRRVNSAFAHDLRTPLTVLKGYSDLLARYLPEGRISEEKLKSTLKLMSEHIGRLEKYTHTMKHLQSMEDFRAERKDTDLGRLEDSITEIAGALDRTGGIRILMDCTEAACKIRVDTDLVLEVLENLLSNAIRYAAERVEISLAVDWEMLYLYVRDDGPGFSEEALEQAGQPYYHESTQGEEQHFGMGLYICRVLCEKHKGTLSLSRSMQGGSCVSASFYAGR